MLNSDTHILKASTLLETSSCYALWWIYIFNKDRHQDAYYILSNIRREKGYKEAKDGLCIKLNTIQISNVTIKVCASFKESETWQSSTYIDPMSAILYACI